MERYRIEDDDTFSYILKASRKWKEGKLLFMNMLLHYVNK